MTRASCYRNITSFAVALWKEGRKQKFVDNSLSIARRFIIISSSQSVLNKTLWFISVIAVHLCDRTLQELNFKTKPLITNKAADVIMWLYAYLVYVRITLLILLFKMTECSKLFRCLGEKYGQLYRSSFNADPVSLQNIETYPFIQFCSKCCNSCSMFDSKH